MKTVILILLVVLINTLGFADGQIETEYKTKLQAVIQKYHSEGEVISEDGGLVYRHHTQVFKIHTIQKSGDILGKPHEEEGPNIDGILVKISFQEGKYNGQAMVPQVLRRPYWLTFINAYQINKDRYIWVSISYGIKTDMGLVNDIKACFKSGAEESP